MWKHLKKRERKTFYIVKEIDLTGKLFIIIFFYNLVLILRNKPQKENLKKILKDYLIKNERICVHFVNRSRSNQFKEVGLMI